MHNPAAAACACQPKSLLVQQQLVDALFLCRRKLPATVTNAIHLHATNDHREKVNFFLRKINEVPAIEFHALLHLCHADPANGEHVGVEGGLKGGDTRGESCTEYPLRSSVNCTRERPRRPNKIHNTVPCASRPYQVPPKSRPTTAFPPHGVPTLSTYP